MTLHITNRGSNFFIIFCIVVSFSVVFSGPIWDIDFWWHLATGKYILENKELPEVDPFSDILPYISLDSDVTLKGYWLAQVIFFLVFKAASLYGIIALRALILLAILLLTYLWAKRNKCNNSIALFLVILAGLFSMHYPTGERPQLFSFFFAPLMVFLLEGFRENNINQKNNLLIFILLPLTMLLWANCHRGFVLGAALLAIYWGSETIKILFKKNPLDKNKFVELTLIIFLTIIASFINPATYKSYLFTLKFQGSALQQITSEYLSPLTLPVYGTGFWPYWAYLFITFFVFVFTYKKIDLTRGIITLFLTLISLTAVRYVPFFIYITIPFTAKQATLLIENRPQLGKVIKRIVPPILALAMIFIAVSGYENRLGKALEHPVKKYRFPEKAILFIKQHSPQGKLFNHFEWGGYLIWELYPKYKTYIDGRNLNSIALRDSIYMIWDTPVAQPLFERYGINIIIIPGIDPFTGELYTIVNQLFRDNQWHLVYRDEISLIFIRGQENDPLIKKLSMPKIEAYDQIIMQGTLMLNSGMKSPYLWQALETAYRVKRMHQN